MVLHGNRLILPEMKAEKVSPTFTHTHKKRKKLMGLEVSLSSDTQRKKKRINMLHRGESFRVCDQSGNSEHRSARTFKFNNCKVGKKI